MNPMFSNAMGDGRTSHHCAVSGGGGSEGRSACLKSSGSIYRTVRGVPCRNIFAYCDARPLCPLCATLLEDYAPASSRAEEIVLVDRRASLVVLLDQIIEVVLAIGHEPWVVLLAGGFEQCLENVGRDLGLGRRHIVPHLVPRPRSVLNFALSEPSEAGLFIQWPQLLVCDKQHSLVWCPSCLCLGQSFQVLVQQSERDALSPV